MLDKSDDHNRLPGSPAVAPSSTTAEFLPYESVEEVAPSHHPSSSPATDELSDYATLSAESSSNPAVVYDQLADPTDAAADSRNYYNFHIDDSVPSSA